LLLRGTLAAEPKTRSFPSHKQRKPCRSRRSTIAKARAIRERSYANVVTGGSQRKRTRCKSVDRTLVVAEAELTESKSGRKILHGSPAPGGDIAQIFDYQLSPREKEAAAIAIGDGGAESVGGRGV